MSRTLHGKTIVITGGSSGVGAAAARIFAGTGARVAITGRSEQTHRIAEEIGADSHLVDHASFADVESFADTLLESYPRIDVLVNNVGGVFGERRITADGNEMTLQVNHLAGFLLTNLLQDRLADSNVVVFNTSSATNIFGSIDFGDLQSRRGYNALRVYATTKLMNILHAMEVDRRFEGVHAASFHPGGVATRIAREGTRLMRWIYESPLRHLLLASPEKGADTLVWLAGEEPGEGWAPGEYYAKRRPGRKSSQADASTARRLWDASEELVARSVRRC